MADRKRASRGVDHRSARVAPADARIRGMVRELAFEFLRAPSVVVVEKRDPIGASYRQTEVACESDATGVVVPNDDDSLIADRFEPRHAVVGRAVIDDDQLPVGERLLEHGRDGRAKERCAVVRRNDD
jgi:hypothetical protein